MKVVNSVDLGGLAELRVMSAGASFNRPPGVDGGPVKKTCDL